MQAPQNITSQPESTLESTPPALPAQEALPTQEASQPHAPKVLGSFPVFAAEAQQPVNPDSIAGPSAAAMDSITSQPATLEQIMQRPRVDLTIEEEILPPADWHSGNLGAPRTISIGDNSGVITIIAVMALLMMLSFKNGRRLFSQLWNELLGMRRRANAFDEHTSGETRMVVFMAAQWCVYGALLIYSAISVFGIWGPLPAREALGDVTKLIGLMAAYYIFQILAYNTLGYVFADASGRKLLMQGFTASQSLLSFALIIPALVAIFYPAASAVAIWVGAGLYALGRIVFIIKGFKIFYTNFGSLLYFILYLCALEIIPLLIVASVAVALVTYL